MAKKGFTGSEIYFQDKFDEFDFWSRYNNMRPKEGWNQMLQDYKDSTKMEEDEWGKPPPIPLSVLKSGLGYILKQLAGGKFNQGKRDFLEKIVKPPKPKPKVEKIEPFKFPSDKQIKKDLDKIFAEIYSKHSTKHAEGGIAGMLGEPRSGYQDGGLGIAKEKWDRVKYLYRAAGGFKGTGKSLSEFGSDVLFQIDRQEGPYFREGGRIGYAGGGAPVYSESDYPHLLSPFRPGGQKPSLSDYDEDVWDLDYIEIPMSGSMKKMKKKKGKGKKDKAEGGRIGLADGDTPSQAWMRDYFYKSGKDRLGVISVYEYIHGGQGWSDYMDHGPGKAKGGRIGYDNGGPVTQEEYDEYVAEKEAAGEEAMDFETYKLFKIQFPMAAGGRIGFQDGRGIMSRVGDMVDVRNVPYYSGKALQGLVNSAETLSKLPLAAGHLGSKLIQQPPKKEMFMEAIEDITPGSWSENVGLTSLIEDMEKTRPEDAKTVGGILGLGTEIAVPTGGAFKAGQFLLNKASKAMGKVKDGKTLNKLVEDKISDSGQSRRDFMSLVGASGLAAGLKWLGLGGVFKAATKKLDDIEIQVRGDADYEYIDEGWSGGTWANVYFKALSKKGQKILDDWTRKNKIARRDGLQTGKLDADDVRDNWTDLTYQDGLYVPGGGSEEAAYLVEKIIAKSNPNWRVNTATTQVYTPATKSFAHPKGSVKGAYEHSKTYSGKDLNKKTIMKEADDLIASERSPYHNQTIVHDEFLDDILNQVTTKKAEGGRIGLDTGGLAGMLGERTGFPQGKRVTKKPKKPKKTMTIEEAIEDIKKKLKAPDITDDESRRLRIILHDLILGPGMGGPRGIKYIRVKKICQKVF